MISILIPVFNFDIRSLVGELARQCEATGQPYEILCFDDGSAEFFRNINREVQEKNIFYREMPFNLGRSAIRNRLGKAARFPYLLFMDCDSKVVRKDFIKKYLSDVAPFTLVYGGRCYTPHPPADQSLLFHWKYGSVREQTTVHQRQQHPWHSFMTNNFIIPKAVFTKFGFDESLIQYGHEDTLFGLQLAKEGIQIIHIDNPLEHIGLEKARVFLEKTEQGLENLYFLWSRGTPIETRLLRHFTRLKRWKLTVFKALLFRFFKPVLKRNLYSKYPSLFIFDLYKLGFLCQLDRNTKNEI